MNGIDETQLSRYEPYSYATHGDISQITEYTLVTAESEISLSMSGFMCRLMKIFLSVTSQVFLPPPLPMSQTVTLSYTTPPRSYILSGQPPS